MTRLGTDPQDRISEALFGQTKRRVLALLFGRPGESFYLRQIARETGAGTGAVQRELALLAAAGLVRRSPEGQHVYFSADPDSPIYDELRSLLSKTAGIAEVLRASLAAFTREKLIDISFIYGSVATGRHTSGSDVDVMIIGRLDLAKLLPALGETQQRLGREINPTIYRPEELLQKLGKRQHFVRRVLEGPRIMLVGSKHDLEELVGEPVADGA